mmetsp:Transcript_32841/g.50180  ORF Transcript_32841/g.50180 Transcript_32841/m.50180 type:complete len:286 (+) Transcript_32841:1493-2350(+)
MTIIDDKAKMIRLANLCFVSCYKVILCSEFQRDVLLEEEDSPLKEFYNFLNKSFILIEPGVNPRKWIHNCNRELSKLITDNINDESEWLVHLQLLKPLSSHISDFSESNKPLHGKSKGEDRFFHKFMKIRWQNKKNLIAHLQKMKGDPKFLANFDLKKTLFEGYLKRITPVGRHLILFLWVIHKYLELKRVAKKTGKKVDPKNFPDLVPRIVFMGGLSRPGDKLILQFIKLVNHVSVVLEQDEDTNNMLRLIFLPNYTTSKEYLYICSLDVNDQLIVPGKQACST